MNSEVSIVLLNISGVEDRLLIIGGFLFIVIGDFMLIFMLFLIEIQIFKLTPDKISVFNLISHSEPKPSIY